MNGKQITACLLAGLILLAALVIIPWLYTPPSPEAKPGSPEREVRDMMGGAGSAPAPPQLLPDQLLTNRANLLATNPLGLPLEGQMLETNLLEPAISDPVSDSSYLQPAGSDPASRGHGPFLLPR
jgi:hypothetical protein